MTQKMIVKENKQRRKKSNIAVSNFVAVQELHI